MTTLLRADASNNEGFAWCARDFSVGVRQSHNVVMASGRFTGRRPAQDNGQCGVMLGWLVAETSNCIIVGRLYCWRNGRYGCARKRFLGTFQGQSPGLH